jgi:hypothetical protein
MVVLRAYKIKKTIPLILVSVFIIMTTESKMAHAYLLIIFILFAVDYFVFRFKYFDNVVALCVILLIMTALVAIYSGSLALSISEVVVSLEKAYLSIEKYSEASRYAPIASYIYDEKIFFGQGLLSYYNPISDSWLYYAGFSLLYSLYYDLGLIYILFFYFFVLKILSVESSLLSRSRVTLFGSFLTLSIVSFSLTDYAFLIALGFVTSWLKNDYYTRGELNFAKTQ